MHWFYFYAHFSCWVCLDEGLTLAKKMEYWICCWGSILGGFWKWRALSRFWRAERQTLLFFCWKYCSCPSVSWSFRSQVLWLLNMSDGPPCYSLQCHYFQNVKEVQAFPLAYSALWVFDLIEMYSEIRMILICLHNPQAFCLILNHQWVSNHWQTKLRKLMF